MVDAALVVEGDHLVHRFVRNLPAAVARSLLRGWRRRRTARLLLLLLLLLLLAIIACLDCRGQLSSVDLDVLPGVVRAPVEGAVSRLRRRQCLDVIADVNGVVRVVKREAVPKVFDGDVYGVGRRVSLWLSLLFTSAWWQKRRRQI